MNPAANANGVSHVIAPREPVDIVEAWIASEARRKVPVVAFELVQRSDRYPDGRLVESWEMSDARSPRELAIEVLARAANEQTNGIDAASAFELVSMPSKKFLTLDVAVRPRALATAEGSAAGAMTLLIDQLRRDQENKEKFIATALSMSTETQQLNVNSFKDRDKQSIALIDSISKAYQGQLDSLQGIVTKLMREREEMVERWIDLTTRNHVEQMEAQRETSKLRMREEVFGGVLKPILPMLTMKLIAGAQAVMGKTAEAPPAAAPSPAPPPQAVTDKQAGAIYALLAALEVADYEAIGRALSDEKRLLFVALAESFMPEPTGAPS